MNRTGILGYTILAFLLSLSALAQLQTQSRPTTEVSQIYSTLRSRFQKERSGNIRMELHDVRAYQADPMYLGMAANRFLVLAKVTYLDTSGHCCQGELFGFFVFDDSLSTILRTIDIINDGYDYTIYRVWKDTLTVHGELTGRDLQPIEKKYKLYFWENYK